METLSSDISVELPAQIEVYSPTLQTPEEPIEAGIEAVPERASKAQQSLLTIEYYQQFFNVDTFMVLRRILNSMIPKLASDNYLRMDIDQNPDLYGPFWLSITLIFSIAISSNIASYRHYVSNDYHWHYNFQLVSNAAICIFIYAIVLPVVLWALFKDSLKPVLYEELVSASYTPTLLSLICIYGYSLALYIPVSILCVIDIALIQWLLVIIAALLTGFVLIDVMKPALRNSKYASFLIIGILSVQVILSAGFFMYFYLSYQDSLIPSIGTMLSLAFKNLTKAVAGNQRLVMT